MWKEREARGAEGLGQRGLRHQSPPIRPDPPTFHSSSHGKTHCGSCRGSQRPKLGASTTIIALLIKRRRRTCSALLSTRTSTTPTITIIAATAPRPQVHQANLSIRQWPATIASCCVFGVLRGNFPRTPGHELENGDNNKSLLVE